MGSQATTEYRKRIKQALIVAFGNECYLCHRSFPDYVYDFHHIDPSTKEFSIANGNTKSKERISNEAHKCIMLCSNCHRWVEHSNEIIEAISNFDEEKYYIALNILNGTIEKELKRKQKQIMDTALAHSL